MFLITGANGQLGSSLRKLLGTSAIFCGHEKLDITNADAVQAFFRGKKIDGIVNCAAYTAVDKAESDAVSAKKINELGAKNLAKTGVPIVHISTDYVFAGTACRPYVETDETCPRSVYGATKLAGERAVLENAETAIVIRTSWLYSEFGNNFVKTMRRLGVTRERLGVVFDQTGTPTYAHDLASAIVKILPQISTGMREIYHFSNEGVCSWFDLAKAVMEEFSLPCEVAPIETTDYPTPAARPQYSVLNKGKIKKAFGLKIDHWRDALKRCVAEINRQSL